GRFPRAGAESGGAAMELVVLIPTFNRPHELKACVESILPVLNDEARVVVIDDASDDDEQRAYLQALSDSGDPVAVVPLIQKHGCTRARMTVLDETTADYAVILDDDAYL